MSKSQENYNSMKKIGFLLVVSVFFWACIKDPLNNNNNNNNSSSTPPTPNVCPSADGALFAVKSITKQDVGMGFPATTITLGTGVGFFSSNGISGSNINRVSAGTVKLNSTEMDYMGETYIATASASDPTGIDFSNGVTWDVSGDNGFGAFTHSPTNAFPTVSEITSGDVVSKSSGYTLTCNTVTSADSVLFLVGEVSKTLAGNATSCTFSSSDLSSVDEGTTFVQIVPYTFSSATVGGKTICFGKEMVQQLSVEVEQ